MFSVCPRLTKRLLKNFLSMPTSNKEAIAVLSQYAQNKQRGYCRNFSVCPTQAKRLLQNFLSMPNTKRVLQKFLSMPTSNKEAIALLSQYAQNKQRGYCRNFSVCPTQTKRLLQNFLSMPNKNKEAIAELSQYAKLKQTGYCRPFSVCPTQTKRLLQNFLSMPNTNKEATADHSQYAQHKQRGYCRTFSVCPPSTSKRTCNMSVGTVTILRAGWQNNRGGTPAEARGFSSPARPQWPASYSTGMGNLSTPTPYLNTMPRLRMHGATHQLPPHTFITWWIIKHTSPPQQYSTPRILISVAVSHICCPRIIVPKRH